MTISAAQAARRIAALGVPAGSATPLAPLGAVALPTVADAPPKGPSLTFATLTGVGNGMLVSGPGIAPGDHGAVLQRDDRDLTAPVLDDVPAGSIITFTPAYTADLQALVTSWLAYPPPATSGMPSSATYQPGDDDANFWPGAAAADPAAFLDLVLAALTQGYVIPAPFNVALGTADHDVARRAARSAQPADGGDAGLGDRRAMDAASSSRIRPGCRRSRSRETPPRASPRSSAPCRPVPRRARRVRRARSCSRPRRDGRRRNTLPFASTTGIVKGMTVTGLNIPPGTTVSGRAWRYHA